MNLFLSIMLFTNVIAIVFFALRYAIRTIHEKKAHKHFSSFQQNDLQFSL